MSRVACVPVLNYFTSDNRVLRTCRFLARHGYEVHVIAVGREDLPDEERLDDITVHRFRVDRRFVPAGPIRRGINLTAAGAYAAFIAGAVRLVRRLRPAVIHANDWNTLFLGPSLRTPHRTIYDMHELFQDLDYLNFPRPVNRVIAGIDRVGLRRADAVLCVSKPIADELRTLTDRPVYVVRNVPDAGVVAGRESARVAALLQDGRKHLVFLGGLQRQKGALEMAHLLARLPSDFALDCFAGVTEKNRFFLDEVARLGIADRVTIHPYLAPEEFGPTLRHAWAGLSFFVASSRIYDYALPNKIFEYLLCGLPVLVSPTRAQAQLVEETGLGLVVDVADPAAAAARVLGWQRPEVTPEAIAHHRLTWEHEEQELARAYRDLGLI